MTDEVHLLACEIGTRIEGHSIVGDPALLKHYKQIAEASILSLETAGLYMFRPDSSFRVALQAWAKHFKVGGGLMQAIQQGMFQYITSSTPK